MDRGNVQPPRGTTSFQPPSSLNSSEFKASVGSESGSLMDVPKPMESLYDTPIPPFLSKTYDLVDDPSLDYIISWGENGRSFVVWEPIEFARIILPQNFKHNNFSSFVRQLNTYGFRKIDTDKWEFTNEGFVRGQKHMLKKIRRRRSLQSQQLGSLSGSSNVSSGAMLEGEMQVLRKERSLLMQEVLDLQHQQRGTTQHVEVVKEKIEEAERRQKQMTSFLAKMFQNPGFLASLSHSREQKNVTYPRTKRKFVKHQLHELEHIPSVVENSAQDDLAMVHELPNTPDNCELVATLETVDPLLEEKGTMNPLPQSTNEHFISSPDDLVMEKSVLELSRAGNESMVTEDIWSMGYEASGAGIDMSSSNTETWGYLNNYTVPDLGVDGELSDIWEIGSLQLGGSSGIETWLDEETPVVN